MAASLVGSLIFVALLLLGYCLGAPIIGGLFASLAFGSTALISLPALGGSSPLVFTGFAILLILWVALSPHFLSDLAIVFSQHWGVWIVAALLVLSIFGAIVLPRLFEGQTIALVQTSGLGVQELPLAPVSGNVTQTAYFVLGGLAFFAIAILVVRGQHLEALKRGFATYVTLTTLLGVIDLLGKIAGAGDVLQPIRTATYSLLTDDFVSSGFWRIAGGFSEASAFGAVALSCLAYTFTFWRISGSAWMFVLTLLLLLLILLSTSSTAYVGISVLATIAAISVCVHALRGWLSTTDVIFLSFLVLALTAALTVHLYDETVFRPIVDLFDDMVLRKSTSQSAMERSYWNAQSVRAFLDTGGLGIGMGSSRSSSWVISVFSQLGAIGALMMASLVCAIAWRKVPRSSDREDANSTAFVAAARWYAIASLIGATVSGGGADPGFLFFVCLAIVLSRPAWSPHQQWVHKIPEGVTGPDMARTS